MHANRFECFANPYAWVTKPPETPAASPWPFAFGVFTIPILPSLTDEHGLGFRADSVPQSSAGLGVPPWPVDRRGPSGDQQRWPRRGASKGRSDLHRALAPPVWGSVVGVWRPASQCCQSKRARRCAATRIRSNVHSQTCIGDHHVGTARTITRATLRCPLA